MAQFRVLVDGYVDGARVGSTVSLVQDAEALVVIDPGLVPGPSAILRPLARSGFGPNDVTDVVISHHHPDHTLNVALFPSARVHDHWAVYHADLWTSRPAEGFRIGRDIRLIQTPGHTPQDITTLIDSQDGLIACTHLWWTADGPADDPLATDADALHRSRQRLLELKPVLIVPGHGAPFAPTAATPK